MIFKVVIRFVTKESLSLVKDKVLSRASRANVLGALKKYLRKTSLRFTLRCAQSSFERTIVLSQGPLYSSGAHLQKERTILLIIQEAILH